MVRQFCFPTTHFPLTVSLCKYTLFTRIIPLYQALSFTLLHNVNVRSLHHGVHHTITVHSESHILQSLLLAGGICKYLRACICACMLDQLDSRLSSSPVCRQVCRQIYIPTLLSPTTKLSRPQTQCYYTNPHGLPCMAGHIH